MPHSPSTIRPLHRLELSATTEEMALRLRHLPGFVWLDTAGNNQHEGEGISILAALPTQILEGHISDLTELRLLLNTHRSEAGIDQGLPLGGLIGSVDYDGHYRFGFYEEWLIHRHSTGEWWELGSVLSHATSAITQPPAPNLNFSPQISAADYCAQVRRIKDYIAAGDIYQVNLTHPMTADWPAEMDEFGFYLRLREISPAPYAAFLDQGSRCVLSSSPESFLKMSGDLIQSRPIKGTRPRFRDLAADQKSMLDLVSSEKERAELLMITDLERNDLGQVCEFGSVSVPELL
jgi:isochorismate synthase EntC